MSRRRDLNLANEKGHGLMALSRALDYEQKKGPSPCQYMDYEDKEWPGSQRQRGTWTT